MRLMMFSDCWLPWKLPLTSLLFSLRPMYVDYVVNDSARVDGLQPVAMLLRQSLEPLFKVTFHATQSFSKQIYM